MVTEARPLPTWLISVPLALILAGGVLGVGYMNGQSKRPPVTYVTGSVTMGATAANGASVATAPISQDWNDYTDVVNDKRLPVIKDAGRVFDAFRRRVTTPAPVAGAPLRPMMGIMVLGLGFDKEASLKALATLPIEAGIALNAQAPYAADIFGAAQATGRELWAHVPTQNRDSTIDEGEKAVRFRAPAPGNIRQLHAAIGDLTHYIGVVFSPGSAVAASDDDMDPIMQELGQRGLGYGRMDPILSIATEQDAARYKVPVLPPAQIISYPPSAMDVQDHLDKTLRLAQESGGALAVIAEPNPVVINTLRQWLAAHAGADVTLVPPSAMASK